MSEQEKLAVLSLEGGTYETRLTEKFAQRRRFEPQDPRVIKAARYHSLAADPKTIPACLTVTARTQGGEIMAVAHKDCPIYGLQFHPESILTQHGHALMKNFLDRTC